jgi:flagellin
MKKRTDAPGRWREIFRKQRASGLSVAAFCRRSRIPQASFYAWRRKLRDAATFTEVRVTSEPDLVVGQRAYVNGLRADIRTEGLDTRLYLTQTFAQTLSSASFTITGGGTLFQLGPEVTPNAQIHVAFDSVRTTRLGNPVVGRLNTLRSGGLNDLSSENFLSAQEITNEAIDQVAALRRRLGNIQRNTIEPNIRSHGITLENIIASEPVIRDADMAEELSNLSRAQILVQSTQSTLQIANSIPNLVLSLLQ